MTAELTRIGRRTTTLLLERAYCVAGTAATLERVLRAVPGVRRVFVNPVTEAAYIETDADACTEQDLVKALDSLGVAVGRWTSTYEPEGS